MNNYLYTRAIALFALSNVSDRKYLLFRNVGEKKRNSCVYLLGTVLFPFKVIPSLEVY